MPLGDLEDQVLGKILIVGCFLGLRALRETMPQNYFEWEQSTNGFDAGIRIPIFNPDCVIVDTTSLSPLDAYTICAGLRRLRKNDLVLVAIAEKGHGDHLRKEFQADVFEEPFDIALLAQRLKTQIGSRKELV